MVIVNRKYNFVYIFWLYAMLFSMFPSFEVSRAAQLITQQGKSLS